MTSRQVSQKIALALVFATSIATHAAELNWYEAIVQSAPPARQTSALAYDPASGRMILYSGLITATFPDHWEYAGRVWSRRNPGIRPPLREDAVIVFDSARGRVILHGGRGPSGVLGDTWEWNGLDWAARTPGSSPQSRSEHAVADDAGRGRVVLFGGRGHSTLALSDTWEWNGLAGLWTQRAPAVSPPARRGHALAYLPATGRVYLFGGETATGVLLSDTWEWNGASEEWTQLFPAASPSARKSAAMAYDSATGRIVLYGGRISSSIQSAETWEWDGTDWVQRAPVTSPPALRSHGLAFDSLRARLVLFGGFNGTTGYMTDTWEWDGSNWAPGTLAPTRPSPRARHTMNYHADSDLTILFAGNQLASGTDQNDTWSWDGASWTQLSPAASPPARGEHGAAYDSDRGRIVMFGGYRSGVLLQDTWEWTGSNWINRTPSQSPSVRRGAALAYDSIRARTVLFGGNNNSVNFGDTWEWNGATGLWTPIVPLNSPSASAGRPMAFDPIRGKTIFIGDGGTWEWDGTNWTLRSGSHPSSSEASMVWDDASGTVVAFERSGALWDWDGTGWALRNPANPPPARSIARAGLAYDMDRDRLVAYGGWDGANSFLPDETREFGLEPVCSDASRVVSYSAGTGATGSSADAARGLPDGSTVSLGANGQIVLQLDPPVADGTGTELSVFEKGAHDLEINENYRVEASEDGSTFALVGICPGGECMLDLGASGLASARFVRIIDLAPQEGGVAPPTVGADIDAITVRQCQAAEICDGFDDDGDGFTDEGCDDDGDGSCDARWTVVGTPPACPQGGGDCDDGDPTVRAGGPQICDGKNNDCNSAGWPSTAGTNDGDDDFDSFSECGGDCNDASGSIYPGAAEACNGIDDDCDGVIDGGPGAADGDGDGVRDLCDNCGSNPNVSQSDIDDDGQGDVCDLDDGLILLTRSDPDVIEWQPESGPESFNVYEGDLSVLRASGVYTQAPGSNSLAQRTCAVVGFSIADTDNPGSGEVQFALVTGVQGGVEGSLGQDSTGAERTNTNPCP